MEVVFLVDEPIAKGGDHWKQQERVPSGSSHGGQFGHGSGGSLFPTPSVFPKKKYYPPHPQDAPGFVGPKWKPWLQEYTPPPPPPPTTETLFRTHKKGTEHTDGWDPERYKLQNGIIDELFTEQGDPELDPLYDEFDHSQPLAVFMVGSPGAGKSYYAAQHLKPHHQFVHLDSDAVKERLPEYDPKNPNFVHLESTATVKRALKRAVHEGKSFIYDSTGIDVETVRQAAKRARDKGYRIAVHHVKVPLAVALERNAKRERVVPEHLVRQKHAESQWAYGVLESEGVADHYVEHDNA